MWESLFIFIPFISIFHSTLNRKHKLIVHQLIWIHFNISQSSLSLIFFSLYFLISSSMRNENDVKKSRNLLNGCNKIHSFPLLSHLLSITVVYSTLRNSMAESKRTVLNFYIHSTFVHRLNEKSQNGAAKKWQEWTEDGWVEYIGDILNCRVHKTCR